MTTDAGTQPPAASELQNKHAREWLETGDDAPADVRKKNQRIEFSIKSVDKVSEKDVTKMTGNDRKVTLTVSGDFLLHGHKTSKTAELEATFHYAGADIASIDVKIDEAARRRPRGARRPSAERVRNHRRQDARRPQGEGEQRGARFGGVHREARRRRAEGRRIGEARRVGGALCVGNAGRALNANFRGTRRVAPALR